MSPEDCTALHALVDAVADDARDLASIHALADLLEANSLTAAGTLVKRLVPQTADVLVGTFQYPMQQRTLDKTLSRLCDALERLGRSCIWVTVPEGMSISVLSGPAARVVRLSALNPAVKAALQPWLNEDQSLEDSLSNLVLYRLAQNDRLYRTLVETEERHK